MTRVYVLLRNDQQTGPYTLQELLQFDLKPYDLIWIEGKSAGWYYPQELKELHPHLPFVKAEPPIAPDATNATPARHVFVAMPVQKKSVEATEPEKSPQNFANEDSINAAIATGEEVAAAAVPQNLIPNDFRKSSVHPIKNRRVSTKGIIAASLLVSVAFACWLVLPSAPVNQPQAVANPNTNLSVNELAATENTVADTGISLPKKTKLSKPKTGRSTKREEVKTILQPAGGLKKEQPQINSSNDYEAAEATDDVNQQKSGNQSPVQSEEVVVEKKKKLGEKIMDLFKKKKTEELKEDHKPSEKDGEERRAVRREAGANLAQFVSVKFNIPNDWMLGIKGAKATLTNRSSESIVKAVVDLLYYNEEDELVDKKRVTFSGVNSKGSATISIPDHPFSTRVDYSIVSLTGASEPYAKL